MKFELGKGFTKNGYYYYIYLKTTKIIITSYQDIAKIIGIPTKKFINHLYKFNARNFKYNNTFLIFENINNATQTINYLNEKYAIILKLLT